MKSADVVPSEYDERVTVRFTVPGRPKPKQRPRRSPSGHFYTPRQTHQAESEVGWLARQAGARPLRGRMRLSVVLYVWGRRPPDGDNCAKLIADALNGVAWCDDRQVAEWDITTRPVAMKTEQRTEVLVERLLEPDRA